jgi:hypothetical protein
LSPPFSGFENGGDARGGVVKIKKIFFTMLKSG